MGISSVRGRLEQEAARITRLAGDDPGLLTNAGRESAWRARICTELSAVVIDSPVDDAQWECIMTAVRVLSRKTAREKMVEHQEVSLLEIASCINTFALRS